MRPQVTFRNFTLFMAQHWLDVLTVALSALSLQDVVSLFSPTVLPYIFAARAVLGVIIKTTGSVGVPESLGEFLDQHWLDITSLVLSSADVLGILPPAVLPYVIAARGILGISVKMAASAGMNGGK